MGYGSFFVSRETFIIANLEIYKYIKHLILI